MKLNFLPEKPAFWSAADINSIRQTGIMRQFPDAAFAVQKKRNHFLAQCATLKLEKKPQISHNFSIEVFLSAVSVEKIRL